MDELRRTIEELLHPKQNYTNEVKKEFHEYLEKVIVDHAEDCNFFFKLLLDAPEHVHVKFWALGAIEKILVVHYERYNFEMRAKLQEQYFMILENAPQLILSDSHIQHKYALLFILIVKADYPKHWSSAFARLLRLLELPFTEFRLQYLDFILDAMLEVDREIVELDIAHIKEQHERRREIKDELRSSVIPDVAKLLQYVIQHQAEFNKGAERVVARALEVVEKLMDWTNLDLYLPNFPHFASFLKDPLLQAPSAKCIYSIINKGMDTTARLAYIFHLNLIGFLFEWDPADPNQEEVFCQTMAAIVNKIGNFMLDCAIGKEKVTSEGQEYARNQGASLLSLGLKCLDQNYLSVSLNVIEFLNHYLSTLKGQAELGMLTEEHGKFLQLLLGIIYKRVQYPKWYSIDHIAVKNSMEEMYNFFRAELTSLFGNMLNIKQIKEEVMVSLHTIWLDNYGSKK